MDIPGPLPLVVSPPLGFRFSVLFFAMGIIPNPLDMLFQKVSGLNVTVDTQQVEEGGQNLYRQLLPNNIQHDHLSLERGMVILSPLALEFNVAMSLFKFKPSNVLVSLLSQTCIPIASWLCMNAYPVKWSVSDLDATSNTVVIEHMELAYQRMQTIRL